jgi:hypothetical protein
MRLATRSRFGFCVVRGGSYLQKSPELSHQLGQLYVRNPLIGKGKVQPTAKISGKLPKGLGAARNKDQLHHARKSPDYCCQPPPSALYN